MYDLIIKNGRVVSGAGNPWFKADVGVEGKKIVKVGRLSSSAADKVIDATGTIVCPGFVDIHNHSDFTLLVNPRAESMVRQGVTTMCIGNCGLSAAPVRDATKELIRKQMFASIPLSKITWHTLGEFLGLLEKQGLACNVCSFVGHGSVRVAAMGFDARPPTPEELEDMKALVAQAMEEGAFGMSTGLAYAPGFYADTDEIVKLAKVVARYGGIYTTHIRSNGLTYRKSVEEAIEIGEKAGVPVQINHVESHYPNFGKQAEILKVIEDARARNMEVTCDIPPYMLGMTFLTTLLPEWAQDGGIPKLLERLKDPEDREKIKRAALTQREKHVMPSASLAADGKWDKIWVVSSAENLGVAGKSLAEIARLRSREPYEAVFDLLVEEGKEMMILGEFHNEDDIRLVVSHHTSMIESDAAASALYGELSRGKPHPRSYGIFPLVFRKYIRGETREEMPKEAGKRILSLEEAVRKMTSFPAQKLGLWGRGLIREDAWADIVVFDQDKITDKATYEEPHRYPDGIHYVIVNGEIVLAKGESTEVSAGRILRGPSYASS